MIARLFLALAMCSIVGCLQPTDTGVSSISLAGRWQYSAQQSGGSNVTLNGTMEIEQSRSGFQGSLEVISTSAETGESRSVAGTLSGSAPASDAIDFDVFFEEAPRRHVARLVGDVLNGTWIRVSADGVPASGTFSARRLSQ